MDTNYAATFQLPEESAHLHFTRLRFHIASDNEMCERFTQLAPDSGSWQWYRGLGWGP